jgi:hypothetical protein
MIWVHDIITRGLEVSIENIPLAAGKHPPAEMWTEGLGSYIQALTAVLHGHHLAEDEVLFPFVRDTLPEAPIDLLVKQHLAITKNLEKIQDALAEPPVGRLLNVTLGSFAEPLQKIKVIWLPHIHIELKDLVDKLSGIVPQPELQVLLGRLSESGQRHTGPPFLTIPFMLYNLPDGERALFAQNLPAEVTQELVPRAWKEHWEPMRPFFLE